MASRNRSQASFGIGAEQFLGMGELGSPPPTEQAVDREISLDVVDKEQIGVLARKPSLLHDRGIFPASITPPIATLDNARQTLVYRQQAEAVHCS